MDIITTSLAHLANKNFVLPFVLGLLGAIATGRACAATWRGPTSVLAFALPLTIVVRFLHFALFESVFIKPGLVLADYSILTTVALLAYRHKLASMMSRQYWWALHRAGPISWTHVPDDGSPTKPS